MRPAIGLLLLVGLLPAAPAQSPFPDDVTVTIAPFPGPVRPVSGSASAVVTVAVSCHLTYDPVEPLAVALTIVSGPEWAVATVSPASLAFPAPASPADCAPGENVEQTATLTVSVTSAAPAFAPGSIAVRATAAARTGDVTADGTADVEASFVAAIDLNADEPVRRGERGAPEEFRVRVENRGNGNSRVTARVREATEGWIARVPDPVLVPAGRAENVTVTFASPADGRNSPGSLRVTFAAEYAGPQASTERAEADASFLLTVPPPPPPTPTPTPRTTPTPASPTPELTSEPTPEPEATPEEKGLFAPSAGAIALGGVAAAAAAARRRGRAR